MLGLGAGAGTLSWLANRPNEDIQNIETTSTNPASSIPYTSDIAEYFFN
jgi:hypothetical protein